MPVQKAISPVLPSKLAQEYILQTSQDQAVDIPILPIRTRPLMELLLKDLIITVIELASNKNWRSINQTPWAQEFQIQTMKAVR